MTEVLDPAQLMTVLGALQVIRMLPVIGAGGYLYCDEAEAIATLRGRDPLATVARQEIKIIARWPRGDGWEQDVEDPRYTQERARWVVLAVAGVGSPDRQRERIVWGTEMFWSTCDHLVHRVDGYTSPEFVGLKTTLSGVESMWQERDRRVVMSGLSPAESFNMQYEKVQASISGRRQIAAAIARCAGWT